MPSFDRTGSRDCGNSSKYTMSSQIHWPSMCVYQICAMECLPLSCCGSCARRGKARTKFGKLPIVFDEISISNNKQKSSGHTDCGSQKIYSNSRISPPQPIGEWSGPRRDGEKFLPVGPCHIKSFDWAHMDHLVSCHTTIAQSLFRQFFHYGRRGTWILQTAWAPFFPENCP